MIIESEAAQKQTVLAVAQNMCAAARTAPKAKGRRPFIYMRRNR